MRVRVLIALCITAFAASAAGAWAQQASARWALESAQVSTGQGLTLTLEIEGTDKFSPPALSVPGVDISFQGGGPRNSTSIVAVNGKVTKSERKSWVGSWILKSSTPGSYHIDAQNWSIGSSTVFLPAINWQVVPAQKDSRFMLRQKLSQATCVPGIEIEYTLTWYLGQSVQNPDFTLPILDNPNLVPVESSFAPPSGDTFQIQYHNRMLTGTKSLERIGGQQYTALTIRFRVKPTKPGVYDLSGTMVSFEGAVDSRKSEDFFGNIVNEPVYRELVAQADSAALTVRDLPLAGKPNPFSGLIGKLDLSWESAHGMYHVGEPIHLKLKLSGVLNKPNLDLDHMVTAAFDGSDFQVNPDPSGKEEDGSRGFIFRARRPGRMTVPPLKINYFDPQSGRYGETATKALSFDIAGSAVSSAPVPIAQASDAQATAAGVSAPSAASPAVSDLRSTGALMNPNGIAKRGLPALPWWAFALPGLIPAIALSLAALWRHSSARRRALERKAWIAHLAPLSASAGRAALEEGRSRLQALLAPGELWRKRLDDGDRWSWLKRQAARWDEAFFSDGRGDEPWTERWTELARVMEAWK
jgi:hypothetical protein